MTNSTKSITNKTIIILLFALFALLIGVISAQTVFAQENTETIINDSIDEEHEEGWYEVVDEEGNTYYRYYDSEGNYYTGWHKINEEWYLFASDDSGRMLTGWQTVNSDRYYLDPDTGILLTDWQMIDDEWYLFASGDSGRMLNGWQKKDDNWYYLDPSSGILQTGWQKINGKWYLLSEEDSGKMLTGWQYVGIYWYYLDPNSGALVTGWQKINGKWYLFASYDSGRMLTGWQKVGAYWYYLDSEDGVLKTGWQLINDNWYLFAAYDSGRMLEGWQYTNGNWYYLQPGSGILKTGWLRWNNNWYYLQQDSGRMLKGGWRWIGAVDYKFSGSGKLVGAWMDVPCYYQNPELPTGCESVALTNALRRYGFNLSKTTIADKYLSWSSTDYITSFIGNPHSADGGMVCAPGIVLAADKYLKSQGSSLRAHNLTGCSLWYICHSCISNGIPAVIWVSIGYTPGGYVYCTQQYAGHNYSSIQNTHTVVLCGYDEEEGVAWVSDSISGKTKVSYSQLNSIYNYHEQQAVVLY